VDDGRQHEASSEAAATYKTFQGTESHVNYLSPGKAPWEFTDVIEQLRSVYPHGHPSFIKFILEDAALHSSKNRDYAFGGDPLGNFERVASILRNYPDFPVASREGVVVLYMLKQLDAVFWNLCQGHKLNESLLERIRDITVYSVILRCMVQK
jgi:hypothetical protein